MHELRKDYVLNRWVIINTERAKRPRDFKREDDKTNEEGPCPFCLGNESLTPPEIARIEENGKWIMRVFPNKYPAVTLDGDAEIKKEDNFFTFSHGYGKHEVVVETPDHKEQLWDLSEKRIVQLLKLLIQRIDDLSKLPSIKQVAVFKNHGRESGTSLKHSHMQIIAYNQLATSVDKEIKAVTKFYKKHGHCPYCELIPIEKKGPRRILENKSFVAFCPYASRFAFEAVILPKKHYENILQLNEQELQDLAAAIKFVISKLKELNAPYNMYIHDAPKGKKLHFHIKIKPRLLSWGGFEYATDTVINTVSPEQAAEFYREK